MEKPLDFRASMQWLKYSGKRFQRPPLPERNLSRRPMYVISIMFIFLLVLYSCFILIFVYMFSVSFFFVFPVDIPQFKIYCTVEDSWALARTECAINGQAMVLPYSEEMVTAIVNDVKSTCGIAFFYVWFNCHHSGGLWVCKDDFTGDEATLDETFDG